MPKYRTRSIEVDAALSPAGLWIVTNPDGWAFTVHPQVFAATYEPIQEPPKMALRFGPKLAYTVQPPIVPEPTPDVPPPGKALVEVQARIVGATPQDNGLFTLAVEADIPPYSAETHKQVLRAWAVVVPDGQPLPETEQAFLDSAYPKATVETAGAFGGVTVPLPVADVPAGQLTVQTIFQDED